MGRSGTVAAGRLRHGLPSNTQKPGLQADYPWKRQRQISWERRFFEKTGKGAYDKFVEEYGEQYRKSKDFGYISLFSANHDINRLNSEGRDSPDQIKTFMTFLLTMPGVPFIHYGDEIMMRNVKGLPSVEGSREERSGTRTPCSGITP